MYYVFPLLNIIKGAVPCAFEKKIRLTSGLVNFIICEYRD
jgi:hypothetical protein